MTLSRNTSAFEVTGLRQHAPSGLYLPAAGGAAANLFDIDWPNAPGPFPACSFPDLTNNYVGGGIGLSDYGPGSTCSTSPHAADIVTTDLAPFSTRALRFNYPTGFGGNGPDFRLPYQLLTGGANITVPIYCAYYVKWSPNYYWAQADSKTMIWGGYKAGGADQDYYLQTRGNAGNRTARLVLYKTHWNGDDSMMRSASFVFVPDRYYLFEWAMWCDTHGYVQVKIDGTLITDWEQEAGIVGPFDPFDHDNSDVIGCNYIKADSTYNIYDNSAVQAWIAANGTMEKRLCRWRAGTLGWLGAPTS